MAKIAPDHAITAARVLCLLAVAAAGGCGGGGAASADGAAAPSCDGGCWQPTAADQDFAGSFCALTGACCARNAVAPDAGAQAYADQCKTKILRAGFSRNSSLRQACLADLQKAAGADACLPDYADFASACMRTFYEPSGPLPPGGHCLTAADCAGKAGALTICEHLAETSVCMSVVAGHAGGRPCLGDVSTAGVIEISPYLAGSPQMPAYSGSYCAYAAGLYCTFDNDPAKANVCTPFIADGAACLYPRTCASGSCLTAAGDQDNGESPGTCGPTPAPANLSVGAACTRDGDCASGNCSSGSCQSTSHAQRLAQLALCTAL